MTTAQISSSLFREVRPDFFRVLAGPLARLYVDVVSCLELEASQRVQPLERNEALAIVETVIEQHGGVPSIAGDPVSEAAGLREKARVILDILRKAGWVHEEERSDWRREITIDANGTILLQALRRIAFPEDAVFSDKLVSVCFTLANASAFDEQPWGQIETCINNIQTGLAELRGMQKSIERHTRHQMAAGTLKENLSVLFDQFSEGVARTCYTQLIHARLPSKLAEARRALENVLANHELLTRMQTEVIRRHPNFEPAAAMAQTRLRVNQLSELLEQVEPLADAIDRRTAEFARRSQARFRYLQETTSERRARVQEFFETLNRRFAGQRVADIEEEGIEHPALLVHDVRLLAGLESLYRPRLRAIPGEIEPLDPDDNHQRDRALAQLGGTMRDSLTVSRANHFVDRLSMKKGAHVGSDELLRNHVRNDEDIADLIACLLHARSTDANFRVEIPRYESDADEAEFDAKMNYRIERFILEKR